jgi:superoxide dismutase, Fe-Mn family
MKFKIRTIFVLCSIFLVFSTKNINAYQPKTFDLTSVDGISEDQLDQHQKLYQGYVKKRNEIGESLKTVDRSNIANITYSPFRALKVAETFALNGSVLHELYFENLGNGNGCQPGPQTLALIKENFGSFEKFKKDLLDGASCARGWVITAFNIDDGTVANYVLEAHNETVPILCIPILVVDTYEHAYMIDFGINRAQYLDVVWKNINWDVVEERIKKWVNKFKTYRIK